jgi:hypothetical protein
VVIAYAACAAIAVIVAAWLWPTTPSGKGNHWEAGTAAWTVRGFLLGEPGAERDRCFAEAVRLARKHIAERLAERTDERSVAVRNAVARDWAADDEGGCKATIETNFRAILASRERQGEDPARFLDRPLVPEVEQSIEALAELAYAIGSAGGDALRNLPKGLK